MAHTKAKGTSKLGRDSASQRLGIKKYAGEKVLAGNIIVRQRGTAFRAGENTKMTKDDTIMATKAGAVKFTSKTVTLFTGKKSSRKFVSVE